mmetsp:Transcript_25597/g.39734  ORF Transcript_25597/g.39734 Transcript_25597/m.39734 type:complete len:105 (+) Transcript_25597:430-744(+)
MTSVDLCGTLSLAPKAPSPGSSNTHPTTTERAEPLFTPCFLSGNMQKRRSGEIILLAVEEKGSLYYYYDDDISTTTDKRSIYYEGAPETSAASLPEGSHYNTHH